MKKNLGLLLLVLMMCFGAQAAKNTWTLDGKVYEVDTLIYKHQVGPGTTFAKYNLPGMPLIVSVLEMDLKNKYVDFETCKSGDKGVYEETPVSMASRNDRPGHEVIGATNGDFYFYTNSLENGIPRSGQFRRDECVTNPVGRAAFVLTDDRVPYIDHVDFHGTFTLGLVPYRLHTVNMQRLEWENTGGNQLNLYTNAYGTETENCSGGKKCIISPKEGSFFWSANMEVTAVVDAVVDGVGVTAIPDGKAVLWGQGTYADLLAGIAPGTEVKIRLQNDLRTQPGILKNFKELMGGSDHIILKDGQLVDVWANRHPRTCIGYNADKTKVFFIVIDGRWSESVGTSNAESGGVFLGLGATDAVNLDGGGSSCMVVNGSVVNRPSDGPVRAVGNGCLLLSNAPVDDAIGMLGFEPRSYNVSITARIKPAVWGYNKYGVLKTTDLKGATFTCDPKIGSIDSEGYFVASPTPAAGNLFVTYNGVTATQPIIVVDVNKKLKRDSVVVDATHPYKIEVQGQNGIVLDTLDPATVNWTSGDNNICTVDAGGTVKAVSNGKTNISGKAYNLEGTLKVMVENPKARIMPMEEGIDVNTWKVTQSGGSGRVVTALDNGMQINYTGVSSRSCYIKMVKSLRLWGIPDVLRLRINPGSAKVTKVNFNVTLPGQTSASQVIETSLTGDEEGTVDLPVKSFCEPSDNGNYPITLNYIQLTLEPSTVGQTYSVKILGWS